jgi:hypothetical protein
MENDEFTLDTQEVQQESVTVAEEATQGEESQETKPRAEVKITPAEYRNFKKWQNSQNTEVEATKPQTNSQPNVEETVLLANGMSEELLGELKAVAKVRGTSLLKAQADPLFIAAKDILERAQRSKEASLPGSRGSGSAKAEKNFGSPNLSREEHRQMIADLNL